MADDGNNERGAVFQDSSTDCAICLSALDNDDDDETTTTIRPTVTLTCGHRWHLECLKEQLEHAQPNHARRLLFSGCRCAKCGVFCDHELLHHLTRRVDVLRNKVDALITEQLQVDAPETWRKATGDRTELTEEGRRTYAFYLCNSCEEPYFGGTIECADQQEGELPSEDRLCPSCAPKIQSECLHPSEHRGYHVWKCRYCCRPSNHVCYGTVHFCQSCHHRNSVRVRQQRGATTGPPPLDAIPCPGGDRCSYPKPLDKDKHINGPYPSCEQVYHCALCISTPSNSGTHHHQIESGSRNLIINPSGARGLQRWRQLNRGGNSWAVEQSEIPVSDATTTNFVSNFQWCVMAQAVPLHRLVRNPSSVRIEVSCRFMGRTDCPSIFRLEAIVVNAQRQELGRMQTAPLDAPADFWERTTLILQPTPGAHEVVMVVYGKDRRFWQGPFGSKVAECSVRVLCPEEELEAILLPEALNRNLEMPNAQYPTYDWLRAHTFDILLPIILLLFVWLMSDDS